MTADSPIIESLPVLHERNSVESRLGALMPGCTLTCTFNHQDNRERLTLCATNRDHLEFLDKNFHRFLHATECATLEGLTVNNRRHDYLLSRYAAKSAAATWGGLRDMRTFAITPGAFSQPVLTGFSPPCPGVTLAHSGGVAVAIAHDIGHPMGIDVERLVPDKLETTRTQTTPAEFALVQKSGVREAEGLMLLWTAREAISKALRCGLTCPLQILAVRSFELCDGGWYRGDYANFGQYQFVAWFNGPFAVALAASSRADLAPQVESLREFLVESCTR